MAHVRIGSNAGMGQKPDDWRTVSLCRDCHRSQHEQGELTFWRNRNFLPMSKLEGLIDEFCKASPKAREIMEARRET